MIKLVVSDMDGTLLNEEVKVSDANAQAIRALEKEGIQFMIATGRSYEGYRLVKEKSITCPFISHNGAQTFDAEGNMIRSYGLEKESVKRVIEICNEYELDFQVFTNDGGYSDNKSRRLESLTNFFHDVNIDISPKEAKEKAKEHMKATRLTFVESFSEVLEDESLVIAKVVAQSIEGPDNIEQIREEMQESFPRLAITSSSRNNIEVTHQHAHKGHAVAEYAKELGLTADEVMTIGDNLNDLTMLKWAKYGTAMENAVPEAKEAANYSTSTNVENGVAEVMTRILNKEIYKEEVSV